MSDFNEIFKEYVLNEAGAKIPLQFWITYHAGDPPKIKPFVVDTFSDEASAKRAADKDPIIGWMKVTLTVPRDTR